MILGVLPIHALNTTAQFVPRIIEKCRKTGIKMQMIQLDREFFSVDVISYLESEKIPYIIPCKNIPSVKEALDRYAKDGSARVQSVVLTSNKQKSVRYTMVIHSRTSSKKKSFSFLDVYDSNILPEERYIGFATNIPDVDVREYSKRWGIETGYNGRECTGPNT